MREKTNQEQTLQKLNTAEKKQTQNSKTKLARFSHFLQNSARKQDVLDWGKKWAFKASAHQLSSYVILSEFHTKKIHGIH